MVMASLFHKAGLPCAIAHCNFSLRKPDADLDQQFVEDFGRSKGMKVYTTRFDTTSYAKKKKLSIQMAARELRYSWLEKIRAAEGFSHIATAHHLDDSIETLLINIGRGTGIQGLRGIPARIGHIVRPMLFAGRSEILDYARQMQIGYREDTSNHEEKYLRNKIRRQIIPAYKDAFPNLEKTMLKFFAHMESASVVYLNAIRDQKDICVEERDQEVHIMLEPLFLQPHPGALLFEILHEYGFTPASSHDILQSLDKQSGKVFASDTHIAVKDRTALIIAPRKPSHNGQVAYISPETHSVVLGEYQFTCKSLQIQDPENWKFSLDQDKVVFDMDSLKFPLVLRYWVPGDKILPLGAAGRKKVSDLLTERKVPLHKKNEVVVLESDGQVIWVAGHRTDETHKINPTTKNIFIVKKQVRKQ